MVTEQMTFVNKKLTINVKKLTKPKTRTVETEWNLRFARGLLRRLFSERDGILWEQEGGLGWSFIWMPLWG